MFPATGYIFLVWQAFAYQHRIPFENFDIEFEDVKFRRATTFSKNQEIELVVVIQKGTGTFEILDGNTAVCTGVVRRSEKLKLTDYVASEGSNSVTLLHDDFYKELKLRGYNYKNLFRSIQTASADGSKGTIKWQANWVAFLDCILQLQILSFDTRSILLPTGLRKFVIHPKAHLLMLENIETDEKILDVFYSQQIETLRCGGIEMSGIIVNSVNRRLPANDPILETYQFIPHFSPSVMDKLSMAKFCVQLMLENFPILKFVCTEIDINIGQDPIIDAFKLAIDNIPNVTSDLTYITSKTDVKLPNVNVLQPDTTLCANNYCIIRSGCLSDQKFLDKISSQFADYGLIVLRESSIMDHSFSSNYLKDYKILAVVRMENENIVLLHYSRVPQKKITKVVKIDTYDETYSWIKELQQALKIGPVIAYAENDKFSGIIGLVNCIRKEPNGHNLKCVFVDDPAAPPFTLNNPFYAEILDQGLAINVYRNGQWGSFKYFELKQRHEPARHVTHCLANSMVRGDLSSLRWFQGPLEETNGDKIVRIQYSSLNFRDVMLATGKLAIETFAKTRVAQQCVIGLEFSGLRGQGSYGRVMGIIPNGALGSHVEIDEALCWDVPNDWTLAEAASCPIAYGTVYYAFFVATKIQKGKTILIHAGSGGVGLAAIRVALAYGLNVFTTVSNDEKKNFILKEFPKLEPNHIGNSRDTSFENLVKTQTNGKGVDYVLNSLSEEKLKSSIRSLAKGGIFLEIGKFDMSVDTKIGLKDFLNGISFHAVLLDDVFYATYEKKLVRIFLSSH